MATNNPTTTTASATQAQAEEKKPLQSTPKVMTVDDHANEMLRMVCANFVNDVPMQEIRRQLQTYYADLPATFKKGFVQTVRTRFDRFRIMGEAAYQELFYLTSQDV